MCLIIDANELGKFFKSEHYTAVRNWVKTGNGKLIQGGSTYKRELRKIESALSVLSEWGIKNAIAPLPDNEVDAVETEITKTCNTHSNDPHILAMIVVSNCRVICTQDKKLIRDFREDVRKKYGFRRLKIFRNDEKHSHLACDNNIVTVCRK